jgi:glycosyltransferase involved in cell wall biosynthesis
MPDILFFGNDWAAENRTSSHQIARWLAKTHRVCYVECPGLRAPKGSGRDLKKIGAKVLRFLQGPRPAPERLEVWTMLQVPLHRFAIVRRLNRLLMLAALRWLIWSRRMSKPITWFMLPHLSSVIGRLGETLSVYYCIDDYSALPGVNEAAVKSMDDETTRRADIVFVASETLLDEKLRLNPHTHVSPHGVDVEHFRRAHDSPGTPSLEISSLPRPIIGFFGLIEQWIDLDLIDFLAEQRPDWSFVMIGRVAVPPEQVPQRKNLHFLGVRPYSALPDYGSQFDAAIIPYKLNRQVMNANPIKLREYLAMGKPIVSVATPEIEKYADVVRIAHSREQFLAHIDAVVTEPSLPQEVRRRVDRVACESWDVRLLSVLEHVNRRLQTLKAEAVVPKKSGIVSATESATIPQRVS